MEEVNVVSPPYWEQDDDEEANIGAATMTKRLVIENLTLTTKGGGGAGGRRHINEAGDDGDGDPPSPCSVLYIHKAHLMMRALMEKEDLDLNLLILDAVNVEVVMAITMEEQLIEP